MSYKLSKKSEINKLECHLDLQYIIDKACEVSYEKNLFDFAITEGRRTYEEQVKLFESGASTTMKSRHIPAYTQIITARVDQISEITNYTKIRWSHAFDFAVYYQGKIRWEFPLYQRMWESVFKPIADDAQIDLEWGGNWKSFKDGPHIQLSWKSYPVVYDEP